MEKQRKNRPRWLRIAVIFLCVGALFGAIWYGAELIGQARQEPEEPEPAPEVPEAPSDSLIPGLARNGYDLDAFYQDGSYIDYEGEPRARRGIDVSAHQGAIDWAAVAADGVEYAMIRVGYRGYTEGVTSLDELFYQNVGGARDAGLDVGVYFFSQAVSVAEAVDEAEIVLRAIEGIDITYPIIYDWEDIQQEARTDGMDPLTLTACARAFCETIENAGYRAGIYFNQRLGYEEFDLVSLQDYLFWLAQYAGAPDFPYDFEMWQYTNAGKVAGIEGDVDLNLSFWQPERDTRRGMTLEYDEEEFEVSYRDAEILRAIFAAAPTEEGQLPGDAAYTFRDEDDVYLLDGPEDREVEARIDGEWHVLTLNRAQSALVDRVLEDALAE